MSVITVKRDQSVVIINQRGATRVVVGAQGPAGPAGLGADSLPPTPYVVGDIPYASTTTAMSMLAAGALAGALLLNGGTGTPPAWSSVWAQNSGILRTQTGKIFVDNTAGYIDRSALITIARDHGASAPAGTPPALWIESYSKGNNLDQLGSMCAYFLVGDTATVSASNKGTLYGLAVSARPRVARDNSPADDVACLVLQNDGLANAKGTDCIYIGPSATVGFTAHNWVTGLLCDAMCDYSLRVGASNNYSLDCAYAVSANQAIRVPSNTWVGARNAADSADVNAWKVNASNVLELANGGVTINPSTGQFVVAGGASGANPLPLISFGTTYLDNSGDVSVSHISLYGGVIGFGISPNQLNYIGAANVSHCFYANGNMTTAVVSISSTGITSARISLSGNISAAAWTTSGIRIKGVAATITDTSSSGTVAAAYTDLLGGNTIAASSATTFTDYYTTFINDPIAGTNVTLTNKWSLGLEGALKVGGITSIGGNLVPTTSDGAALGTTALMISDLFLASGAVINFNAGNMTLTHAAGKLTLAGGPLHVTPTTDNADKMVLFDNGSYKGAIAKSNGNLGTIYITGATVLKIQGHSTYGTALGSLADIAVFTASGGVQIGAPTGGDKGAGTINAAADIYKNNSAYNNPDFVFEQFYTGRIEKFAKNERAKDYAGLMPLAKLRDYTQSQLRLPGINDGPAGVFARGDIALEKLEEAHLYILELYDRIELQAGLIEQLQQRIN